MKRIFPMLLAVLSFLGGCPAWIVPPPSSLGRATPPPRRTWLSMSSSASSARTSEHLSRILFDVSSKRKSDNALIDHVEAIATYFAKADKVKNEVSELSMNLVAEQAIVCQYGDEDGDIDGHCNILSAEDFYGNWRLLYSTNVKMQVAIATCGVCQDVFEETDGTVVLRNIFGSPGGIHTSFELPLHQDLTSLSLSPPSNTQKRNRLYFKPRRAALQLHPLIRLSIPKSKKKERGYTDIVFCDGRMRVDWDGSGAINIYSSLPEDSFASVVKHSFATAAQEATKKKGNMPDRVFGIRLDGLSSVLIAAAVASFPTSVSAIQHIAADDAQLITAPPPAVSNELAALLVAPLLAYKAVAIAEGNKLLPQLDFVILASILALIYKFTST